MAETTTVHDVREGETAAVFEGLQVLRQHEDVLVGEDAGVAVTDPGQQHGAVVEATDEGVARQRLEPPLEGELNQVELFRVQLFGEEFFGQLFAVVGEEILDLLWLIGIEGVSSCSIYFRKIQIRECCHRTAIGLGGFSIKSLSKLY